MAEANEERRGPLSFECAITIHRSEHPVRATGTAHCKCGADFKKTAEYSELHSAMQKFGDEHRACRAVAPQWTWDAPSEPGFYWFKADVSDAMPEPVRVDTVRVSADLSELIVHFTGTDASESVLVLSGHAQWLRIEAPVPPPK